MFSRQQSDEVQVKPASEPKFSWFSSLRRRRTMESMPTLRSGSLKRSTLPFKRRTTVETQGTNGRVEKYATLKVVTQTVEAPQVATTNLGMTSSAPSQQLPAAAAASVPVFDEKPKHDSSPFEMENDLQDSFVIIPQKIQKGLEHVPPENLLTGNIEEEQSRNLPNSVDLTNKENMPQPDKRSVAQSKSESVCPGPVEVEQTEATETDGKQRSNQITIQMRERDRSESVCNVARDSLQLRNEEKERECPSSATPWRNKTNNDDIPAMYKNISNFQNQSEPEPTSPKGTNRMRENKAGNYEEISERSNDLLESNISTSNAEPMQRNYTWESNRQNNYADSKGHIESTKPETSTPMGFSNGNYKWIGLQSTERISDRGETRERHGEKSEVISAMSENQVEKINQAYKKATYNNQQKDKGDPEKTDKRVLDKAWSESDQLQSHIPEDDDAFRATASGEVEHVLSAAMSSEGDFDWRGDQIGRRDETEESEAKREHEGVEEQFSGVSAVREGGYVEGRGFDASGYGDRDDLENIVRESDQLQSHIPEDDDAFRATASGEVEHVLSAAMSSEGDFDCVVIKSVGETKQKSRKRNENTRELRSSLSGVSAVREGG
ncbi:hypothetical protein FGIG_10498 [Fasciola gigantica]|uniref:Uncharacterized protein n=1 Tax=Fasciola gigantica TaxID=46835 RepID=A0A504YFN3_FASGI|nr:hypothetical protein FGIG_10498 [Fasciola gigantica]